MLYRIDPDAQDDKGVVGVGETEDELQVEARTGSIILALHLVQVYHRISGCFLFFDVMFIHLCYTGFGHINQKPTPDCSCGRLWKQFLSFLLREVRGSAFYMSFWDAK